MFQKPMRLLLPAAALLIALAWPAHVLAADRTAADLDCQVSALALSSEFNSDNAHNLLERPHTLPVVPEQPPPPANHSGFPSAFRGRAPPSF